MVTAEVLRKAATELRAEVDGLDGYTITKADVRSVWLNSRKHLVLKPAVALAVADWLEEVHANLSTYNAAQAKHAFTVARAYLGAES